MIGELKIAMESVFSGRSKMVNLVVSLALGEGVDETGGTPVVTIGAFGSDASRAATIIESRFLSSPKHVEQSLPDLAMCRRTC